MITAKIHERHMQLIDEVNSATTRLQRINAERYLHGFRGGLEFAGIDIGELLIMADTEQMERGNNQDMCGGVFL